MLGQGEPEKCNHFARLGKEHFVDFANPQPVQPLFRRFHQTLSPPRNLYNTEEISPAEPTRIHFPHLPGELAQEHP